MELLASKSVKLGAMKSYKTAPTNCRAKASDFLLSFQMYEEVYQFHVQLFSLLYNKFHSGRTALSFVFLANSSLVLKTIFQVEFTKQNLLEFVLKNKNEKEQAGKRRSRRGQQVSKQFFSNSFCLSAETFYRAAL